MMMNDKPYELMQVRLGSSVEQVVEHLQRLNKEGYRVAAKFNGVMLHSDTVTQDNAHQAIVGMTKAEYDEYIRGLASGDQNKNT